MARLGNAKIFLGFIEMMKIHGSNALTVPAFGTRTPFVLNCFSF